MTEARTVVDKAEDGTANQGAIVIDLGKKKRKQVRRLRRGKGRLMDKVDACLEELQAAGVLDAGRRPVVVVVERKSRRNRNFPF